MIPRRTHKTKTKIALVFMLMRMVAFFQKATFAWFILFATSVLHFPVFSTVESALTLCYSVAEYCAPVWRNSAHANLVDVQLNNTMMTITGAVRCTRTEWLPVLSSIAPADICRGVATSRTILRARGKPELHQLTDIDFHPRPRMKSRRPILTNLPDEECTIQQLWHT